MMTGRAQILAANGAKVCSNYVIIICREIIFYDMELLWQLRERNFGKGNMILHCILFPQYW